MKVGAFDSGLGGLTVVKEILQTIKGASVFYIADTAFAPYGDKNQKDIENRCIDITKHFIQKHEIDALVIACNTATSAAVKLLRDMFPTLIIVGMEPGVKPAFNLTKSGKLAVLATKGTLSGVKYQNLVDELSIKKEHELFEVACVGLVEQIENGFIEDSKTKTMLENWLFPLKKKGVDTIVLGCTHYPLISHIIEEIMDEEVSIVQTGYAVAKRLEELSLKAGFENQGNTSLEVAHTSNINKKIVENIFNKQIELRKCEI